MQLRDKEKKILEMVLIKASCDARGKMETTTNMLEHYKLYNTKNLIVMFEEKLDKENREYNIIEDILDKVRI